MIQYKYLPSEGRLAAHKEYLLNADVIGVDSETTGLDPHIDRLRLIQLAVSGKPVLVIDIFRANDEDLETLSEILASDSVKVFQNAKFDINFLKAYGFKIKGPIFDTMLAANLLRTPKGPKRLGLGALAEFFLGINLPKEEQTSDFTKELRPEQIEYAARDAQILLDLRSVMSPELRANQMTDVAKIEFECTRAVADIEYTGILLDIDCWSNLTEKTRIEYGAESVTDLEYKVSENILFKSKVEMFSNLEALNEVDVNWDNLVTAKVSEYINVSFNLNLFYDRDISKIRQIKQTLAVGLSYSFL